MIRDTWRAVLVVVTAALLREIALLPRPAVPAATPAVATGWQPQYQQHWAAMPAPEPPPPGPIRRVAKELVDLADTVIEVVR